MYFRISQMFINTKKKAGPKNPVIFGRVYITPLLSEWNKNILKPIYVRPFAKVLTPLFRGLGGIESQAIYVRPFLGMFFDTSMEIFPSGSGNFQDAKGSFTSWGSSRTHLA